MRRLSLFFAALVAAGPLAAQDTLPVRPRLPAGLDTLDSRAYYEWAGGGVRWTVARDAYYWASRLEPDDPKYALHYLGLLSPNQWDEEHERLDSAAFDVMVQNPFPGERTTCLYIEGFERHRNRLGVAYLHYQNGCFAQADTIFGEVLAKDPSLFMVRIYRATGLYRMRQYERAANELQIMLDSLRARDAEKLVRFYQSKALLEYMRGVILAHGHKFAPAREAFTKALTEDLSFYMAHVRLAEIEATNRKPVTAANELGMAVELRPANGVVRYQFGAALVLLRRFDEAETQLREAIRIEPYWAQPHYQLGLALEGGEKYAEAITAFNDFVAHSPRRLHVWADSARTHTKDAEEKLGAAVGDTPSRLP
jgi:tetratricopeptide (TPR) repeat protein